MSLFERSGHRRESLCPKGKQIEIYLDQSITDYFIRNIVGVQVSYVDLNDRFEVEVIGRFILDQSALSRTKDQINAAVDYWVFNGPGYNELQLDILAAERATK